MVKAFRGPGLGYSTPVFWRCLNAAIRKCDCPIWHNEWLTSLPVGGTLQAKGPAKEDMVFAHITSDPAILGGKPCIRGTRISIEFILELFASGATRDDILRAYPHLTTEGVTEALRYAARFLKNETPFLRKIWGVSNAVCAP